MDYYFSSKINKNTTSIFKKQIYKSISLISFLLSLCIANTYAAPGDAPTAIITSTDSTFINISEVFDASLSVDPNGDPLFFNWDFGDGTFASGINVTHIYANGGTYTVTLSVLDGNNPATIATKIVNVLSGAPTAVISSTDTTYINNLEFFDASLSVDPNGDPLFFNWDFGDGMFASGANVSHSYFNSGSYTVRLEVFDGINPPTIATKIVNVLSGAPTAVINSTDTTYINNLEFFDASLSIDPNGDPLFFNWDFGDGMFASGANVSHSYLNSGSYTVRLEVFDGINPPTIATKIVNVLTDAPTAIISSADTMYINNLEFFDASLSFDPNGDPLTFHWDFGDGTFDSSVNASHVYATAGSYTVRLEVFDSYNPPTVTTKVVNVLPEGAPTAVISSADTMYINNLELFDAAPSFDPDGDPLTFNWAFGDGTFGSGVNVSHIYTTTGNYTVQLEVSDGINPATITTKVVNVLPVGAPTAVISSADTMYINIPEFFDAALSFDPDGDPLTFNWDFGDGTFDFGINVSHVYATAGSYTVRLEVSDGINPAAVTTKIVNVLTDAPIAVIDSADNMHINTPQVFDAAKSFDPNGDPLEYLWDFGDGTFDFGVNVSHVYTTAGSYTVRLEVKDGNNPATVTTKVINILPADAPTAVINSADSTYINFLEVFDASLSFDPNGDPLTFNWDFGDGTFDFGVNISHVYVTAGSYTVRLEVFDGINPPTITTKIINVLTDAPTAVITSADSIYINSSEVFDASLSVDPNGDPLFFNWDFGDGKFATGVNVSHTYKSSGSYTVELHVLDGYNPPAIATKVVTVLPADAPTAVISSTDTIYINTPEMFDASLSTDPNGDLLTFDWDFGDGSASSFASGVNVTHTYVTSGTYTVRLLVNDGSSTLPTIATKTVTVATGAPTAVINSTYTTYINNPEFFDASLSTDPNGDTLDYFWDFGDGTTAFGVNVSHTYITAGSYTVRLEVIDGSNPPTVATKSVTVATGAPTAVINSTDTSYINNLEFFDASLSADPNGDTLDYFWDFGDGTTAFGVNVSHTYITAGSYTVRLDVIDGSNPPTVATKTVTVATGAPTAVMTSTDTTYINNLEFFDASLSTDPNGDTLDYFWDFGDGTTALGVNVSHTYTIGGLYTVRLDVIDGSNPPTIATKTVTVATGAPTAVMTSTDSTYIYTPEMFDASLSADPNGDFLTYNWDFGNGGFASGVNVYYEYPVAGSYTVALSVSDGNNPPTIATKTVTVAAGAPTAVITSTDSTFINTLETFDASLSADPNGDLLTFEWDFGDGSFLVSGVNVTHTYATSGTYTVRLFVDDGSNPPTTATKTVTVFTNSENDFDGDGLSDIPFYRSDTGGVRIWEMNGGAITANTFASALSSNYQIKHFADVNNDAKQDIIWYDSSTGTVRTWIMNGGVMTSNLLVGTLASPWTIAQIGDFNNDGQADILWYRADTGSVRLWLLNNGTLQSNTFIGALPTAWTIAGLADVNGDNQQDIIWRNGSTSGIRIWQMNGTTITTNAYIGSFGDTAWNTTGFGDFNNDGNDDLLFKNTTSGAIRIWEMTGTTLSGNQFVAVFPTDWVVKNIGDYNNDGTDDILWQHSTSGGVRLWPMTNSTLVSNTFIGTFGDTNWAISGHGDYNGGGMTDILWYNPTTGVVRLWLMNGATINSNLFVGAIGTMWAVQQ